MATAAIARPPIPLPSSQRPWTVADLLAHLGVPPERIRLDPPPGTATEEDVVENEGQFGRLVELIDGVLVEKPAGFFESRLAMVLVYFLESFLEKNDLGIVLGEAGMIRLKPGQVRMPDVAFYSWDQFPNRVLPPGSILVRTPDLAVEILSPSNTKQEMARKRSEYFAGGARLVWEVVPKKRTVRVYTSLKKSKLLREKGTLDGGTVLPGFQLKIKDWFARAWRQG